MLFQEQWINLISKFTKMKIDEVCKLKSIVAKRKYSLNSFIKLFPKTFKRETIEYFFEIVIYLPAKSHTVAEAQIVFLALNIKI